MDDDLKMLVDFAGLELSNPVFTASGTCGYADELGAFMDVNDLGGFITKSITPEPRKGNPTPRVVETDAGMLNAIGLANIGLERFVEEKLPVLAKMKPAVFVNVAGRKIDDYVEVAQVLAQYEAISGFELNISCPNVDQGGVHFGTDPAGVRSITEQVKQAAGAKVLMVKLTPCVTNISPIAEAALAGGADAISLVNTFTGMAIDARNRRCVLANRTGGLSGPAIKPMALHLVNRVYNDVTRGTKVPILGLGGIKNATDAVEFMLAGASAVAVGTYSFVEPDRSAQIVTGIGEYCRQNGFESVSQLTGALL